MNRRSFIGSAAVALAAATWGAHGLHARRPGFRCPPCGCAMDGELFDAPGRCPACGMTLQPAGEVQLGPSPAEIPMGAGRFTMAGRSGAPGSRITIHYFRPARFHERSPILLVVPGAGRNGGDYRNDWLETAERTGALIASLEYPEEMYDFAAYHLGGVASEVVQRNARVERRPGATVVRMDDDDLDVRVEPDRSRWLFPDLDRVFEQLKAATGSTEERYACFGHSAGGQILHRAALFHPTLKASHIVAGNAGFYTLPDPAEAYPLGLGGTGVTDEEVRRALGAPLTLLLGELDNGDDAGGTLLHTPAVDRQGLGRLDRGRTFFAAGQALAERIGAPFGWGLEVVPGVGHDHVGMAAAAARLLFPMAREGQGAGARRRAD